MNSALCPLPLSRTSHTCTDGKGVVLKHVKVSIDAVQTELPLVSLVTATPAMASPGSISIAGPVAMTGSLRTPYTGWRHNRRGSSDKMQAWSPIPFRSDPTGFTEHVSYHCSQGQTFLWDNILRWYRCRTI